MRKRLTVSYLEERGDGVMRSSVGRLSERAVPYLRLRGRWLRRLGFAIGTKLAVEAEPGRLVLTLLPEGSPEPPGADLAAEVCEPAPEE